MLDIKLFINKFIWTELKSVFVFDKKIQQFLFDWVDAKLHFAN